MKFVKKEVDTKSESSLSEPEDEEVTDTNSIDTVLPTIQITTITLASFEGIHSGVPTRTTSTLTPTTLRNIEQTYLELTNEIPSSVPCQAGFVPPLAPFNFEPEHSLSSSGSLSNSSWQTPPPSNNVGGNEKSANNSAGSTGSSTTGSAPRRNMGGRRPAKPSNLSPEEEEKRKTRRERNKLAAARCRKRRVELTNDLVGQVDNLEKKKQNLQSEITQLQQEKEDLEFLLDAHRAHCRMQNRSSSPIDIKPNAMIPILDIVKQEPVDSLDDGPPSPKRIMLSGAASDLVTPTLAPPNSIGLMPPMSKPSRPSSLNVPLQIKPNQLSIPKGGAEYAPVPIQTPSTGMFNFDSLMDGGTGLTPVAGPLIPCSSQNNRHPLELTTPTSEPSKLVSL